MMTTSLIHSTLSWNSLKTMKYNFLSAIEDFYLWLDFKDVQQQTLHFHLFSFISPPTPHPSELKSHMVAHKKVVTNDMFLENIVYSTKQYCIF